MERPRVVERGRIELLDRADARAALRQHVVGVLGDHEALHDAVGRREHALAQLLLDDRALALEHLVVDHRPRHALGVGPQHRLEVLRGDDLVVVGAVVAGRGVALAADVLGQAVDHVVGHVLGLAAENMLEQVGEARAALGIVLRADVVPHRSHHVGGGRVGDGDHGEAVGELPLGELDRRRGDRGGRRLRGERRGGENGERGAGEQERTKHRRPSITNTVSPATGPSAPARRAPGLIDQAAIRLGDGRRVDTRDTEQKGNITFDRSATASCCLNIRLRNSIRLGGRRGDAGGIGTERAIEVDPVAHARQQRPPSRAAARCRGCAARRGWRGSCRSPPR